MSSLNKYILTILVAGTFLPCLASEASHSNHNEQMYEIIHQLQPSLSTTSTSQLIEALNIVANEPNGRYVQKKLLLAIAYKESSLIKSKISLCGDVGLVQVSKANIKRMNLNKKSLKTDETYALRVAAYILAYNKAKYHMHTFWIGIYNTGTNIKNKTIVKRAIQYDHQIKSIIARIDNIQRHSNNE